MSAEIDIDACATPARLINGVVVGGVEDCAIEVAFGGGDVVFTVTNPSPIPLTVTLGSDGDAFRTVFPQGEPWFEVPPVLSRGVVARVTRIEGGGDDSGSGDGDGEDPHILVDSNAGNTAQRDPPDDEDPALQSRITIDLVVPPPGA